VVGSKLSIYFQNIINVDLSRYWIDVTCSVGKQYKNRWEYTPDTTGTYTLTIDLYDQENNYLATANTTITVKSSTVGTGINRNSIFIGDSTLNAGVVTQRLLDDFSADPMDITLYGTRGTGSNKYEGRGGWSAATYRTNTVYSGVANPFYDSGTSDFNFNKYMTDKGYPVPDYVFIQLGINGIVGATDDAGMNSIIASEKANYDFIINNIHAYNSSIKICVYVTFPPNEDQDAFANAYGCDINQWRYKRSNFNWASNLISSYQGREAENIYIVPVNVALDCVNGYTVDDPAGGAVHPNTTGYNQIGDAVYQFLKGLES
jgi:lysophospholipase L1-like esterase